MTKNGDISFDIEQPDLRGLLSSLKEINPKLVTRLRRELRQSGDEITQAQKRKLREGGGSSTGLRDRIAQGLKTRIVAGKTRQGIDVKTTGPKVGGYNLARIMQATTFRHPVFGSSEWVDQSGHPYFFEPATNEVRDLMRNRIEAAIEAAVAEAAKTK
ncbi:MAG: hypothetical protein CMH34_09955 [Microbacterium sp.]|nr:hypothetical protein [Microbacterium sp.]